jgi:hypothetical protein
MFAMLKAKRRPCPPGKAEIEYSRTPTFSNSNKPAEFMERNKVANVLEVTFVTHPFADAERLRVRYTCFESP